MHGSDTLGSVDRDKEGMNTMSECQVKAVRGSDKSMMEPLESMKDGARGKGDGQDGGDGVRDWKDDRCRVEARKRHKPTSLHSRLWWIGGISQMGILRVRRSGVQEEADGAG